MKILTVHLTVIILIKIALSIYELLYARKPYLSMLVTIFELALMIFYIKVYDIKPLNALFEYSLNTS